MSCIYNFIKLNKSEYANIIVFICEISDYKKNKELNELSNIFYDYLLANDYISNDSIIIISYIKHITKTIKNITISKVENSDLKINTNTIINNFLKNSKSKPLYDNFLAVSNKNSYSFHYVKKKFSIKKQLQYFYCLLE
jgi:hypothetical protein